MVLPVVLVHTEQEWSLVDALLFALFLLSLVLLVLEEHGVLVWLPLVIAEEAAASERGHFGCGLPPN
eukprot:CAMPEP_0185613358 /NCGR_PEP_ID=MMETSP0436-20130131/26619_1 /TAXON_ID=626734 ORGANISM="Favella taraikaensis, Strain Fe Narragansett Bay" /NCGR_SAMPLE_ID=MMETSP0436 /ASSEMBLY_ACC=CAM_ASM_000390 /LENGTH=66 /DNA_ID=CAMNT_0028247349 /DNA_START=805 /DNA_END=1005 /DNA_ORIENTATION=+